jgi:hypothetical protein
MAIRAHELTLGDLCEDSPITVLCHERADIRDLLEARQVIPVHRGRVEGGPAVRAWCVGLELAIPTYELLMTPSSLAPPLQRIISVVALVVLAATCFAPRVATVTASMKRVQML